MREKYGGDFSDSSEEYVKGKEMRAYWKEWENLESKDVWDWISLAEWDDVAEKARKSGEEVYFLYVS